MIPHACAWPGVHAPLREIFRVYSFMCSSATCKDGDESEPVLFSFSSFLPAIFCVKGKKKDSTHFSSSCAPDYAMLALHWLRYKPIADVCTSTVHCFARRAASSIMLPLLKKRWCKIVA